MSARSAESVHSRSRDNSPDRNGSQGEKRTSKKRKVLSCYPCRDRKMKCDRVYPICSRCQKTGRANICTYDPRHVEDLFERSEAHVDGNGTIPVNPYTDNHPSHPTSNISNDSVVWKLREADRRLERLELFEQKLNNASNDHISSISSAAPTRLHDFDSELSEPKFAEERMFRGKGLKTQFHGSTSVLSLVSQFRELQAFTRESLVATPQLTRIRGTFKSFREQKKAILREKSSHIEGTDEELLSLLPRFKGIIDSAVTYYFLHFEITYRILHLHSFRNDYMPYLEKNQQPSTGLAAILILIVAITKNLIPGHDRSFAGDSSVERDIASSLIETVDAWLLQQSRRNLTIEFFQIHCLSIIAKRVNCVKLKQDWVSCGDLVRTAIAAGLHRDPLLLGSGRTTEYEREMRKRLWATIMELELQSSIDCGLQSSLCGLYFDVPPPAHVDEEQIMPITQHPPTPKPADNFTASSFLIWSLKSLPLRVQLMQLLNNPTTDLHYADVLHYDIQINSHLEPLYKLRKHCEAPSIILDIQLRIFLLMLHRPYAKLASKNSRFGFSLNACINAANSIISQYESILEDDEFAPLFIRNDLVRTVMTLAQVVYANSALPNPGQPDPTVQNPPGETLGQEYSANPTKSVLPLSPPLQIPRLPEHDFLSKTMLSTAIHLMQQGHAIFEAKVERLGTAYMESWLLSAAIGIMPSTSIPPLKTVNGEIDINSGPDDVKSRARNAVNNIAKLCLRIMDLQTDRRGTFYVDMHNAIWSDRPAIDTIDVITESSNEIEGLSHLLPGPLGILSDAATQSMGIQGGWDTGLLNMQGGIDMWNFPDLWTFDWGGDM